MALPSLRFPRLNRERPARLVWICALLLSACVLGLSVLFVQSLREETLQTAERDLARYSLTIAEQADRSFKSVELVMLSVEDHILRILKDRPGQASLLEPLAGPESNRFLKEKLSGLPQLSALIVFNAQGKLVNFSRDIALPNINGSDREFFIAQKDRLDGITYISAPVETRGTYEWTIFLSRRLSGPNGELLGVLIGGMTVKYFEDLYARTSLVGSATSLMRDDGTMLARYPLEEIGKVFPNGPRMLGKARTATIRELSPIDGLMRIKSAHRLANFPVYILATQTEESLLRSWYNTAVLFIGLSIGLAVLLFVAAGLIVRWWRQEQLSANISNEKALAETARAEAEAGMARERERAADAASKVKSSFLATMSHEIRTPMNGVLGMADLLTRTELTPHQQRLLGTINQSATTLLAIINDILDISRIEAGKLELESRDFDVLECAETVIELFTKDAQKKGLELSLLFPASVPTRAVGDAGRLRQVLTNLVGNAVKFTRAGEITVRVAQLSDRNGKQIIQFAVTDTGIGIDDAAKALLFKPFVQADSTISRQFGGTGLGLSIAQHLVGMMDGDVSLASEVGHGTTVTFHVALGRSNAARVPAPTQTAGIRGQHVLVVDERAANREIMCSYLADCGALPVAVTSAHEALAQLRLGVVEQRPFALAILDMVLPGIDGIELARQIKSEPSLAGVRLIMVASLSSTADVHEVREVDIGELLSKPIRRSDLLEAVRKSFAEPTVAVALADLAPKVPTPVVGAFTGIKILIAEDNPVNQEVAAEYVRELGCEAHIAENGRIAVEAFSTMRFDAVLMDCQMPEMDGFAACRKLREIEAERGIRRTPVIAATANAYESDRLMCKAAGMDDFMSKPFTAAQLAATLNRWLERQDVKVDAVAVPASRTASSPPASTQAQTLDIGLLQKFEMGKSGMADRLVAIFLVSAAKTVQQIMMAVVDGDHAGIGAAAHGLKSSSATIGAMQLARLATVLEDAARTRLPIEECLMQAVLLKTELGAVEKALREKKWQTNDVRKNAV